MSAIPQMNESETKFFESGGQEVADSLREPAPAAEPPEEQAAPEPETAPATAAAPERESRESRFVPLQALQEERAEKKQLREELRQYREWQAQLAQRLQQMPAPQAPQTPDPQTRPLDYINHVLGNMQSTTAELQRWRAQQEAAARQQAAVQQTLDWADEQGRDYAQTQPEYPEAYSFAEEARDKELKALGYGPVQRAAIVKSNRLEIINNAMQQGRNPAELVWDFARARGFLPKGGRKSGNAESQAKIAAGLQAAGGKLNQGGATGEGELQAKDLANISDPEEFEKAWKKIFGKRR
jgi:hypothetical protein